MNELKVNKELWEQAQTNARNIYEEENGSSWDEADKYEREDLVWAEYEKLKKESTAMRQRDSKGRFISSKVNTTTNTNSNNVKENDIMMNKNNAKDTRMDVLKANGIDTSNFFNLSMQIPFGAEVKIVVGGKEMVIPATDNGTNLGTGLVNQFADICSMANDSIAQSIIDDGYIKNNKLFRRWIFAQTIKMLNYVDPKNPNRKGWEACFHDCYDYNYQFKMLLEEIHVLAVLQKEDPEQFTERTHFFNGDVVVATLNDYLWRLKKYIKKQMRENRRCYRGEQYVKLSRYGNVLISNLDNKVYGHILNGIANVKIAVKEGAYRDVEKALRNFMNKCYNKLPYETPKCAVFKDAFKGAGAYYSLQNAIRFHNVVLEDFNNKYDSETELYRLLDNDFKNDVWAFHKLLVDALEYNNFDFKQSIANGNAAPNTISTRALVYKRG